METLNMSKLNLSSVQVHTSTENDEKIEQTEADAAESNLSDDSDDEYQCEYEDDIWNNLLEQEAQKPVIHLQSPQLEFRGALVQQLRSVSRTLGLGIATLHSAVAHLDLFMDAHRLRPDRLTHVALACLSLAAKSEEKFSVAPGVAALSRAANVALTASSLRRLELAIWRHARWRLLAPTPASFALRLRRCVLTRRDLRSTSPELWRRLRKEARRQLRDYLDLTLSDVRLKVLDSAVVGGAVVASARAALGLPAWPAWLPTPSPPAASSPPAAAPSPPARPERAAVLPVARLLMRMMQIVKSREGESDIDQGYGSARTSPSLTPRPSSAASASPAASVSPAASARSALYRDDYSILDETSPDTTTSVNYYELPTVDLALQRVDNPSEYSYCRSTRLLEPGLGDQPSTSVAVKRGLDPNVDFESKRYRLSGQMSQVVL